MNLVFHNLHNRKQRWGHKRFLYLQKVFKRYTLKQGSPNYSPRVDSFPWSQCIQPAEPFSSGRKDILSTIEKLIHLKVWFIRMWHIPKQSYYVRCPALEVLCNSLGGPLTKNVETPALNHAARYCFTLFWLSVSKKQCLKRISGLVRSRKN